MTRKAKDTTAFEPASQRQSNPEAGDWSFQGFEPLTSNYVYCPNQFLDICLKSKNRGMVRIIAYVLRQTLGWLDENGQPIHQTVKISYRDLIEKAGVSRGAIGKALKLAVASGFIECKVPAEAKANPHSSQTAEYTLRWDHQSNYTTTFAEFNGFFAGEGYRSPIPNSFFDTVIPKEQLSVTKVVGSVLRHTVGYQNQFGGRRTTSRLSYTQLQNFTSLSDRSTLAAAIRHATSTGYIQMIEAGSFSHDRRRQSPATYGVRWLKQGTTQTRSSKTRPEQSAEERFKNQTSVGSKTRPVERFKNQTSIEKKDSNNIHKQHAAANSKSNVEALLESEGFDQPTIKRLVLENSLDTIQNQLAWIDSRKPKNRIAMLRRAIKENWNEPEIFLAKTKTESRRRLHAADAQKRNRESQIIAEKKRKRMIRKERLLEEWGTASLKQRSAWIMAAANLQSAEVLGNIIRKEKPESTSPSFHVLDELARHFDLPTVSIIEEAPQQEKMAAQIVTES